MYDQIKAAYLKKIRQDRKLKLDAVASLCNYSASYINELERCKKNLHTSEWKRIFEALDEGLPDDEFIFSSLNLFSKFYEAIYYMQKENITYFLKQMEQNDYENSPLFLNYHLSLFIYHLSNRSFKDAEKEILVIDKFKQYLNHEELFLYHVFLGSFYMYNNLLKKSNDLFHTLLNSNYKPNHVISMLHYYTASIYFFNNNLLNAYYHIRIAKDLFTQDNNIYRYCIALQLEANIYSEQREYDHAIQLFENLLSIMNKEQDEKTYYSTYINYAYCLIKQKKFKDALSIQERYSQFTSQFPQYYLNKALCLYNTNKKECLNYVENIIFSEDIHEYFKILIKVIEITIKDEYSKEIEKLLQYLLKNFSTELDSNAKELILDFLLEYYKRTNNIRKQLITLEALYNLK